MRVYSELLRDVERPLVLAIGFFDGMHRGHRILIDETRRLRKPGWRVGVLTFSNHPASYLRPGMEPACIHTPEERIRSFAQAGVEECFSVPFNEHIAQLTPEQFMREILIQGLGVRGVVTGATFRFGHQRVGDAQIMAQFFKQSEIQYIAVPNVTDEGGRISSSRIRDLIAQGQTEEADRLLGRSYEIRGVVERGAGRGHGLGFPTANVQPPNKLLPKDGVYAATARFDGRDYPALVSIGTNPTFTGENERARTVEAWIRDFHHTIYGCELSIRDLRYLRSQKAFTSVDELIDQMHLDKEAIAYPSY